MYHDQLKTLNGKPVVNFDPDTAEETLDCAKQVYRISPTMDESNWTAKDTVEECLQKYLAFESVIDTEALVFGPYDIEWSETPPEIFGILVEEKNKLPNLRTVFFGDTLYEEAMLSTIYQSDFTPFFEAFPGLQHCHIRSGEGLKIKPFRHIMLEKLVLETSGMDKAILANLLECVLPELTHLELWMGSERYGSNSTLDDIRPFFEKCPFPKLRYFGVKCSEKADQVAEAIVASPLLEQLEGLDLSGGCLTDVGGKKLLASPKIASLKILNLEENYLSEAVGKSIESLEPVIVNLGEQKDEGDYGLYVAVDE